MRKWITLVEGMLNEAGEEGYLYHWMDMDKTEDVFENDYMPARWTHHIDGRDVVGNSFSRNKVMSFGEERCVRLTIDKRALAARHKIIPLDGEFVHFRTRTKGKFPKPSLRDRVQHSKSGNQFAEEFVVGDIEDLSRYIVKVDVRCFHSGRFVSFVHHTVQQYCNTHDLVCELSPDAIKYIKDAHDRWADDD